MADIEIPEPESIEEAKASRFTKVGALSVAGFAVILAVCSLGGSNAGKDVEFSVQVNRTSGQRSVTANELLEIKLKVPQLFADVSGPELAARRKAGPGVH